MADNLAALGPRMVMTHDVICSQDTVIKRFQSGARAESEREWRALKLLAEHAPGLAPEPVSADLESDRPVIVMSRVPGEPLISGPVTDAQLDAIAAAINRLHGAIPVPALAGLDAPWPLSKLEVMARQWATDYNAESLDPVTRDAYHAALAWLDKGWARSPAANVQCPVFAHGDANLANYLWNGSEVHLVDFEDAGQGDRIQELVDFTEHLANWNRGGLDAEAFLNRFDLNSDQRFRALQIRRLAATCWTMMLLPGRPAHHRNPPDTLQRQATRLLGLLAV